MLRGRKRMRLGAYITQTDERNADLAVTNLLGVSIEKRFVPSIANTVGTDLSKYKVVHTGEFAYGPVTSRNGDKVSIARLHGNDCIISSSYISFKVVDDALNPDYLMLWFMRLEFDRYARFKSHGSAREIFDWEQLCDVDLPVPSLGEQQKVVDSFKAVNDRIYMLRQLNDKLEALTDLLFRFWLGECGESNWDSGTLADLAIVKYGKDHSSLADGPYPVYGSGGVMRHAERYLCDKVSVLIPRKGTLNNVLYVDDPFWSVDTMFYTILPDAPTAKYLYHRIKNFDFESLDTGTSIPSNSTKLLNSLVMKLPPKTALSLLEDRLQPLYAAIKDNSLEIVVLNQLKSAELNRLGR